MTKIMMMGIDHNEAPIEERERFSFTKNQAKQALKMLKKEEAISGCLLLSTCNRTELWISGEEDIDIQSFMEKISGSASTHFIERRGDDALGHLFRLTCGLESQLTGEDQILTQVKDALALTRDCQSGDTVLDRTFRCAVSAAKKVKSSVRLSSISPSAAKSGIAVMEEELGDLKDIPCLIIGNGQIGKLLAEELLYKGAKVTMTLRKRIHGMEVQTSILPEGCEMIPYENRVERLGNYRCVISATLSPHFTVKAADVKKPGGEQLYLDLAVPRDIEVEVGNLPGVRLYNMDQISRSIPEEDKESRRKAERILREAMEELQSQLAFEGLVPAVGRIAGLVQEDIAGRMRTQEPEIAAEKSLRKLLFGLRRYLPEADWSRCFSALEKAAMDDTLKTGERNNYEQD